MVNYKDLGLVNTERCLLRLSKVDMLFRHSTQQYGTDAGYHQGCS